MNFKAGDKAIMVKGYDFGRKAGYNDYPISDVVVTKVGAKWAYIKLANNLSDREYDYRFLADDKPEMHIIEGLPLYKVFASREAYADHLNRRVMLSLIRRIDAKPEMHSSEVLMQVCNLLKIDFTPEIPNG